MSWFLSYFVLVTLSLFFSAIAYYESLRIIKDESRANQEATINQFRLLMDDDIKHINTITDFIVWNTDIRWLVNSGLMNSGDKYSINIRNSIKNLSESSHTIERIYLCGIYENSGMKIFPEDYRSLKIDWNDILKVSDSGKSVKLQNIINRPSEDNLFFVKSFPIISPVVENAFVITLINQNQLRDKIKKMEKLTHGSVILVNNENDVIITSASNNYVDYEISKILGRLKDENVIEKYKDRFIISYAESEVADVKYVSVIPADMYKDKVAYLRNLIYLMIALFISAALGASYIFSKKNYNPLMKIMNILENKNYSLADFKFQEYNHIFKQINKLIEENRINYEKVKTQHNVIKTFYLSNLISGKIDPDQEQIEKSLDAYDISFIGEKFAVALYHLNNPGQINLILYNILSNISEQLKNEERKMYVTEVNGFYVSLFSYSDSLSENDIDMLLKKDSLFILEHLESSDLEFSILLSGIKTGVMDIRGGFQEAMISMDYEVLKGYGKVIKYSEISNLQHPKEMKYLSFHNMSEKYLNFVRAGVYEAARELIHIEIEKIVNNNSSIYVKKTKLSSLITLILNSLEEIPFKLKEDFKNDEDFLDSLIKCQTFPELSGKVDNIFNKLISNSKSSKPVNNSLSEGAINYITKNFHDNNLSINSIADELGVSIQYLSVSFKKQTGSGLLTYLHKVRRDKAKDLLVNTKISIKDIAGKIGYYTDIGFIRAFKRHEGITPGKYREMKEQSGENSDK
jgi:AraC-like DNA-binding protein